jgi:predicted RNase H-like nuclease (RuvC/YqgF family)
VFEIFKKPYEEHNNGELNTQKPCGNTERDYLSILEALNGEEKSLLAEKSQLLNMEETLRQKIRNEIEAKKYRIENLKNEIPELKQRCEALAKVLNIPVQK